MNTDFLCEKRLLKLNPEYHTLVKNTVFVLSRVLEKYKTYFPDFTDHTILHSLQVLDFCNRLLGEQVLKLNEDELYVLIMSTYLHDSGMGISEADYKELYDTVVSEEYRIAHPVDNIHETIRSFHQKFSRQFIYKYAQLFEIPSESHINAIATVSEAHRKLDLFDEDAIPSAIMMPNGNEVHLPLLAALIRLADELDIAADRNMCVGEDACDTIFKMMHRSVRHLNIEKDCFVLDVIQDDPALYSDIESEMQKLKSTLNICAEAIETRTDFKLTQKDVRINRLRSDLKHITVIDTDLGTDDACALFLLNILPQKPDYIVASFGNATLEGACKNAVALKKYLGLKAKIVKGMPVPDNPDLPIEEKGTFHGNDGLANCSAELINSLGLTESEIRDVMPFGEFSSEILKYDSITYITIGTPTNFAALLKNREFCRRLSGAYVMGGGINEFNCGFDTEFNFSKDPKSVKTILSSGLNITLFPLDVTNHQVLTSEQIDELEAIGKHEFFIRLLRHNLKANTEYNGISAAVLHDALPVLYISHPELFTLKDMRISCDSHAKTFESADGEALHICTSLQDGALFRFMKKTFETA